MCIKLSQENGETPETYPKDFIKPKKGPVASGPEGLAEVNSPKHYNQGDIECLDAMIAAFGRTEVEIYAKINAFKYQWRQDRKGKRNEDVAKAIFYLRFSIGDDPRE